MKTKRGRPREFNDVEVKALIAEEFRRHGFLFCGVKGFFVIEPLREVFLYQSYGDTRSAPHMCPRRHFRLKKNIKGLQKGENYTTYTFNDTFLLNPITLGE